MYICIHIYISIHKQIIVHAKLHSMKNRADAQCSRHYAYSK